jgi:hypothetical protein
LGEIFKDQQRSHRLANKYFVLPLQSEPSDQGHFKFLILATHRWNKNINNLIHSLNTHITQLSLKTSNQQQWPIREQT